MIFIVPEEFQIECPVKMATQTTIESEEQASNILNYCHYPTYSGNRGYGLVRDNDWGNKPLTNRKPIIIAQIETKDGVDNLDDIIKCGFDYYIIGPYDLSNSLGCPAEWDNELYIKYINTIENKIDVLNLGIFLVTETDIDNFIDMNTDSTDRPKIIVWGMDAVYIRESMKRLGFL